MVIKNRLHFFSSKIRFTVLQADLNIQIQKRTFYSSKKRYSTSTVYGTVLVRDHIRWR